MTNLPKLSIVPTNTVLKTGAAATIWAQLTITAPEIEEVDQLFRAPLDLVIVLDRSSSMEGEKLRNAKIAAKYVLSQLSGSDRACVIAYDSHVEIITELSSDHQTASRAIDRLQANSLTALAPALYQAMDCLRSARSEGRMQHVFLLSDGDANVGDRNGDVIASKMAPFISDGMRVSTFGLGRDYKELLMEQIAVAGSGGYHYLATADDAPRAFAAELDQLLSVTLRDAQIKLSAPRGIKIRRVLGNDSKSSMISIGDVPAGSARMVMVELDVCASTVKARTILNVSVRGRAGLEGEAPFKMDEPLTVTQSRSEAVIAGGVNTFALARLAELEAAEAQRLAALAADQHDFDRARQLLEGAQARVTVTLQVAGGDAALHDKLGQLTRDIAGVQGTHTYDGHTSKAMRFSSYQSRSGRS